MYATETSQFLAPYESSIKPKGVESPAHTADFNVLPLAPPGSAASSSDVSIPAAVDNRSLSADISQWNPFGEQSFSELTEDHIFGAEFDKIRKENENSKCGTFFADVRDISGGFRYT